MHCTVVHYLIFTWCVNLYSYNRVHPAYAEFGDDLYIIFNDDNSDKLIMRLRIADNSLGNKYQAAGGDVAEGVPAELADHLEDDTFLKLIEANILSEITLQGAFYAHYSNQNCSKI